MSPHRANKLVSLLTEIHSDIRQIKTDLQSVVTALKEQQQKQTPASSPNSDDTTNSIEGVRSGSPADVLRYLWETRGMIPENSGACGLLNRCDLRLGHLMRMPAQPIFFRSTKQRSRHSNAWLAGRPSKSSF